MGYEITNVIRDENKVPSLIDVLFTSGKHISLRRLGNFLIDTTTRKDKNRISSIDYNGATRTVFAIAGKTVPKTTSPLLPPDLRIDQGEAQSDNDNYNAWLEKKRSKRRRKNTEFIPPPQEEFFRYGLPHERAITRGYTNLQPEIRKMVFALERVKIYFSLDGWLLVRFWKKSPDLTPEDIPTPDIDKAIRQQVHIWESYMKENKGEVEKLRLIREALKLVNTFLAYYKFSPRELRERLVNGLTETLDILERCRDEGKVVTREKAEKITTLEDSLGRDNPGAMAAMSMKCLRLIAERIAMISLTQVPYAILRKEILEVVQLFIIKHHRDARNILEDISAPGKWMQMINIHRLEEMLNTALYHLDAVFTNPLKPQAMQSAYWVKRAKQYLGKKNWALAERCLEHAYHALRD